ncbi:MAG: UDP-N-acetylmuramoyl-L-alanyl-D-glutamate--2,6-diaminopimelate ligase [Spirochaetia bacterium]|nr:UDP-N-acetylmuramoyl-L-alanyl-D-glutamate--2,6-diaminopimelate ligase [Spirochaetia bacterium]
MAAMELGTLLKYAGDCRVLRGNVKNVIIKEIAENSGSCKKGSLFVCVKGVEKNGHDYAADAAQHGASAVIVQHETTIPGSCVVIQAADSKKALFDMTDAFYAAAKKKVKIIGVTGTKGKTTVTYLLDSMLKAKYKKDNAVIGTIGYRIGRKLYRAENTTPSNVKIHRMIAEAADKGIRWVIIEASSHALDQGRLKNITFDRAVLTNVTRDHFDYHKTFANYLRAKLTAARENLKKGGVLVVNADSKGAQEFIKEGRKKKAEVLTYSWSGRTDLKLKFYDIDIKGMDFELEIGGEKEVFHSKLVGEHNIYNVMAAVAALHGIVDLKTAERAVRSFKTVKGRLDKAYDGRFTVLVDFAHTPDSLEKILTTLNELKKRRIITVFGAGGNRDRGKRPMMGEAAARLSDKVIVTSDNPRFEEPQEIIKDVLAGIKDKSNVEAITDRRTAIAHAIKMAQKDDIILLAGKGHEDYQIVKDKKLHFDDRETVLELIKELKCD